MATATLPRPAGGRRAGGNRRPGRDNPHSQLRRLIAIATKNITHDTTADVDVACQSEHSYISDKRRYLARLKRIEGQSRSIHRMTDEEKSCIDILTQVSALNKALESVALGLLDDHLKQCVLDAAAEGGSVAEAKLEEASDAIARLVRS